MYVAIELTQCTIIKLISQALQCSFFTFCLTTSSSTLWRRFRTSKVIGWAELSLKLEKWCLKCLLSFPVARARNVFASYIECICDAAAAAKEWESYIHTAYICANCKIIIFNFLLLYIFFCARTHSEYFIYTHFDRSSLRILVVMWGREKM